jgi:hypothetical protein
VSIRKGQPWGRPARGPAEVRVEGDDDALASVVADHPRTRIAFAPTAGSDFARALGLVDLEPGVATELPCDALRVRLDGRELLAVNMTVIGVPPDRQRWWHSASHFVVRVDDRVIHDGDAVAVVVANGQYLRGADVVPRGHPGDGRIEVQVYAVSRRERRALRARLPLGTHVPHPGIRAVTGRRVEVTADRRQRLEVDGVDAGRARALTAEVAPAAFTLLV